MAIMGKNTLCQGLKMRNKGSDKAGILSNDPPKMEVGAKPLKGKSIELKYSGDGPKFQKGLKKALGTADRELVQYQVNQILKTFPNDGQVVQNINTALAALHNISPKDSVESMLSLQMIGTNNLALEFMRRTLLPEQSTEVLSENVNRTAKLLRAFSAQVEALSRYRNKGKQTVIVKHLSVENGGKAIVGNVNGPRRGRGFEER